MLTDATFGYVPQSVGTVGGECEAGVCLSDESRIGEDFEDRSDEEEYSTFGDPPTVDTVGGEFEAVVDDAVEASSDDDDDEDSSDDEADSSYVEEDTVGCEGAALSMALLGEEAMVLDDKKSKGGGCCTDSSRRLKTDISVIGNSPSGIKNLPVQVQTRHRPRRGAGSGFQQHLRRLLEDRRRFLQDLIL